MSEDEIRSLGRQQDDTTACKLSRGKVVVQATDTSWVFRGHTQPCGCSPCAPHATCRNMAWDHPPVHPVLAVLDRQIVTGEIENAIAPKSFSICSSAPTYDVENVAHHVRACAACRHANMAHLQHGAERITSQQILCNKSLRRSSRAGGSAQLLWDSGLPYVGASRALVHCFEQLTLPQYLTTTNFDFRLFHPDSSPRLGYKLPTSYALPTSTSEPGHTNGVKHVAFQRYKRHCCVRGQRGVLQALHDRAQGRNGRPGRLFHVAAFHRLCAFFGTERSR